MVIPVVRPARRGDLAQLAAIYNHYVEQSAATFDTEPTSAGNRAAWLERLSGTGPFRLLVATDTDRVLGYASSSRYRAHPAFAQTVELGIYLDPVARAKGVGSLLYGALFEELRSETVHLAVAGIALPNDASVALHRKFGFTDVGSSTNMPSSTVPISALCGCSAGSEREVRRRAGSGTSAGLPPSGPNELRS